MKTRESLDLNLDNIKKAFKHYSDKELKKVAQLFRLMKFEWAVNIGSNLAVLALKMKLPFVKTIIKKTFFHHFCGGTSLLDSQETIERLWGDRVLTVLDYGKEGSTTEEEFDNTFEELLRSVEFAAANNSTPVIVCKLSGMGRFDLFEKMSRGEALTDEEERERENIYTRFDALAKRAEKMNIGLFVDAEESWIQDSIDRMTMDMMEKYNRDHVTVFKTYQLYRHDKLEELKQDHLYLREKNIILGAKIVRGAYMDKENEYAEENNVPTLINPSKEATDEQYDEAIRYCIDHYIEIASCCASHNEKSNLLQAQLIHEKGLMKDHPHLNFSQLFGMSDHITYNIADQGYNVAKYVPYGAVEDVVPYLVRRAKENTSVTGDMSRELSLIRKEMERRGIR